MRWRELWPFGRRKPSVDAAQAVESAELSHAKALGDREVAARLRAEADHWADQVRAHNTANRYDDFLRRVVQGRE